ncbi:MAG: universal stress protein [Maribacter sp.]|nr:universal stress protein [Maribacter sp.]
MLKILLPSDFSDNSQKAIDYAIYLFEKEECTFYLLHAYHDVPSASGTKFDSENDLKHLAEGITSKTKIPNIILNGYP